LLIISDRQNFDVAGLHNILRRSNEIWFLLCSVANIGEYSEVSIYLLFLSAEQLGLSKKEIVLPSEVIPLAK